MLDVKQIYFMFNIGLLILVQMNFHNPFAIKFDSYPTAYNFSRENEVC